MLPVFGDYDAPHGHGEVHFNNVRVPIENFIGWSVDDGGLWFHLGYAP
jgi:alkylation response protein AidB-like acyl-CoA dehydrogenase